MTVAITAAVLAALKANTALVALLGGQYVYPRHRAAVQQIPGVYLITNSETSKHRPGYNVDKKRDSEPVLQVDIFHSTTAAACDAIADAVDVALLSVTVTGTRGWRRVSRSEQFEEDTGFHHVALRFQFAYTITDP